MNGLKAIVVDFGGVVAEEGFREGLLAIARICALDPGKFFSMAERAAYETGYVTGMAGEADFWARVRQESGAALSDNEMRAEILSRFALRPDVLEYVDGLRGRGLTAALLTDQTNWLEEIDASEPFLDRFDMVFNSYLINMSKRQPETFAYVCAELGIMPPEALFVDDNPGHIARAASEGLHCILYEDFEGFKRMAEAALRRK